MKRTLFLTTVLVACSVFLFAQATTEKKPYQMYSTTLMKAKQGHEDQFEAAVKAHNTKYHPTGPHFARLSAITYGSGSDGWYIWGMGPTTYTQLDGQPQGNKAHDDDWSNTVDPHVESYGEANIWRLQEDLSYTPPNYMPDKIDVWSIDLKMGERYRFAELMKKWKKLWDEKKYSWSLRVFYNELWNADGPDATIVYSFSKYADFDDDTKWREDYEAMYGVGSWDQFWKEWRECVVSVDEHIREFVK